MKQAPDKPAVAPLDRPVFYAAVSLLVLIVGVTALAPEQANSLFTDLLDAIVVNGSWYYVLVVAVILLSLVVFAFTSYGDIKLGPDHAEPEYSFFSWFAMLFAAGMGIGLMFFGVAEPVMHYLDPPRGDPGTIPAAREAMKLTFFHWGLHAWSIYAIVAVMLAYFGFRHGLPLTLRSALYPLIGERIYGPIGVAVDVFAILGTTFGVATSLGFGVEQISAGLNYLLGVPKTTVVQVGLIVITTALATVSVVLGLDAGIKRLSEFNILLAALLVTTVLVLGPTVLLLQTFMQNIGSYLADLVGKTFNLYAYDPTEWLGGWTIFYWGWWISWAPFVGLFIARISRGRTLRQFVLGAMLGPALFTLLWMTVFGNSAIELIHSGRDPGLATAVQDDVSVALFHFLENLPMPTLLSGLAIVMVLVFFVTSADSGALVLNMLSSNGRDDTPTGRRVLWMVFIGASAVALLLAGGLPALQTAAIASALPFSVAVLAAIWGFSRALSADRARSLALSAPVQVPAMGWRERLDNVLNRASHAQAREFVCDTVLPAMREFAAELHRRGVEAQVVSQPERGEAWLEIPHGDGEVFLYQVVCAPVDSDAEVPVYRVEVHRQEGSLDYDIMGWSREHVALDLVAQYEKHLRYLHTRG